jgi:hypothetical protein
VKKCASCTKDLPDAALHCVFCGAKQPPAPAVQQGLAKTAFGYSANEVLEQARQGRPPAAQPAPYNPPPRTAPAALPPNPQAMSPGLAPTLLPPPPPRSAPPAPMPPPAAPLPQQGAGSPGAYVPLSAANAKTMFVQAAPPPGPGMLGPTPGYPQPVAPPSAMAATLVPPPPPQGYGQGYGQGQMQGQPQGQMQPPVPARQVPIMAIPAAQPPPYLSSQTASRVIRPIDPWQDSLRAMMFLWGLALIAAFVTPLATSPSPQFLWTLVLDGAGTARLLPLTIAAVGLLSVVLAVLPMPTAPRGLIATVLALAGIAVPIALVGVPPWQMLVPLVGLLVLVPSLIIRSEYRGAMVARLLVTAGVLAVLAPMLIPQNGAIPLVSTFKALIDLPGSQKVAPALAIGLAMIVVISLLAWLPSPATGAAKLWAWLLILWSLVVHVTHLVLKGNVVDAITSAPNETLVSWVAGGAGTVGAAYLVLVGYGLACAIGRQLE